MIRKFLRNAPQFLILGGIFFGSTAIFIVWWFFNRTIDLGPRKIADIGPLIALIESKPERLLLVDNDLYDIDTGNVVFSGWIDGGMPNAVFYDAAAKKMIAQFPHGFLRCNLAGKEEARVAPPFKGPFSSDRKWVLFAKERDIWRADVNWKEFRLANEKKVTSVSYFNEPNFAGNIILATEKTLLVRHLNKLLRVDLDSGSVKESDVPLNGISKRMSPDQKHVVGLHGKVFYCYDVDANVSKTVNLSGGLISDYQWLGPERCAIVHEQVGLYHVPTHELKVIAKLPQPCTQISLPSPDGRFVLVANRNSGFFVDLKNGEVSKLPAGDGFSWVGPRTVTFSRDVPDSDLRGSWLLAPGEDAKRISPEPFTVQRSGPSVLTMPKAGLLVFGTRNGLSAMKLGDTGLTELLKLGRPANIVSAITEWQVPD